MRVINSHRKGNAGLQQFIVSHYKLNGNSNDAVGANNGTDTNISYPTTAPIIEGNYADFSGGTDAKIVLPANSGFDFEDGASDLPFSISLWYNFGATPGNARWLSCRPDVTGFANNEYTNQKWQFWHFGNYATMALLTNDTNKIVRRFNQVVASIPANTWFHYVATYNGSGIDTGVNLYLNGVLQPISNANVGTYTGMPNNSYPVALGRDIRYTAYASTGKMDELTIWNKELTQEEITEIYNKGTANQSLV